MQNKFETIASHTLALRIAAIIVGCGLLLAIPATIRFLSAPTIVYQPIDACTILTENIARSILGGDVINRRSAPTIDTDTKVATSKCSYSDTNQSNMSVIALAVQSGIDDSGINKIKKDFAASRDANKVEAVDDLGKEAFFNPVNGQLHVLGDYQWYIFNTSSGDDPTNTTKEKAVDFAHALLDKETS